jgi:hypothetical protein
MDPKPAAVGPAREIRPLRREEQRPLPAPREKRPATQQRRRDPTRRVDEYASWR